MADAFDSALTAAWHALARCKLPEFAHVDFFPAKGINKYNRSAIEAAKQVCADCPVRRQCLEDAIDRRETYGIWGGLTLTERRRIYQPARQRGTV